MASLFRKPRSPFWYLRHKNKTGKWVKVSTGLRADDPNENAQAGIVRAKYEAEEIKHGMIAGVTADDGAWDTWVDAFLSRHCETSATLQCYRTHWKWLALWLATREIRAPKQMSYRHALEYVEWRTSYKKRTGKTVGRNTAKGGLKVLAIVMAEAVRLEFITANPLARMKVKGDIPRKYRELTDEEIFFLREKLRAEPEWMQTAFDIALYTGCRLRETVIPLTCIDLKAGSMTFGKPKGGEKRAFSIGIPTVLRPLFERLKAEKRRVTLELPFQPSRRYGQFLEKLAREAVKAGGEFDHKDMVFHSLRVTFINRLRREGVPREAAMRMVNHSSELVHQVYQRERFEDVLKYRDAVQFSFSLASGDSPPNRARKPDRGPQENSPP